MKKEVFEGMINGKKFKSEDEFYKAFAKALEDDNMYSSLHYVADSDEDSDKSDEDDSADVVKLKELQKTIDKLNETIKTLNYTLSNINF
mgnify:FL=1